jgi:type II secretory pathway component GspD/PulD (secretin)
VVSAYSFENYPHIRCRVLKRSKYTLIAKSLLPIVVILLCHLSVDADSSLDRSISLDITNRPLSEVLDRISKIAGYRFIYDREWADENISVKIVNQDLDKSLRMVLGHYNYGILYGTNANVRIMIYGEKSVSSSSPANASPSVEYGHVGSAEIQEEDTTTRQDIEENQTGEDSADTAEGDQGDDLEENNKITNEDDESDREPKGTETGEMDNSDPEKDLQETETPETDA